MRCAMHCVALRGECQRVTASSSEYFHSQRNAAQVERLKNVACLQTVVQCSTLSCFPLSIQEMEMRDDDQDIEPLVIDTSATVTDSADYAASEAESLTHTGDATQSTEIPSASSFSPVRPSAENCDDEDADHVDYEELIERRCDESVSSDSLSTTSKDLTGSTSAGDLSPGSVRCSKSRRKADRVRTVTFVAVVCL